jgi:hypothetical protein
VSTEADFAEVEVQGLILRRAERVLKIADLLECVRGREVVEEWEGAGPQADPRFAFRVAFIQKVGKPTTADVAYTFIKEGSEEAKEVAHVLLKEVDKPRFTAGDIVKVMHKEGYPHFMVHHHTDLWKSLNAKKEESFGKQGPYKGTWLWFEPWVTRVRAHCQEKAALYK